MTVEEVERVMCEVWIRASALAPTVAYDAGRRYRIVRIWKGRKFVFGASLIVRLNSVASR